MENTVVTLKNEVDRLNTQISDMRTSCSKRENELDGECQTQQRANQNKQVLINHLTDVNNKLQENLTSALEFSEALEKIGSKHQPEPATSSYVPPNSKLALTDDNDRISDTPSIILFHDSLCRTINNTMMSRENISMSKIWAPTMDAVQREVMGLESEVDAIVIHSLTRKVGDVSPEDLTSITYETVDKCLTKAGKVIISLIVDREDDPMIRIKAEAVNAMIKLKYVDHPQVLVCHHNNLRERTFKKTTYYT